MRRKIKTSNLNLNPGIEEYLDKRLEAIEKIVDVSNPTLLAEIELARTTRHHQSGDIFRAELNLALDGEQFRAEAESADLNSAIDAMKDEILNELRSYKGRRQSLLKRSGAQIKLFLKKFYK